jgi:ParB family chromosome partitioning protein
MGREHDVLYRRCAGVEDHVGGPNHYASAAELEAEPVAFARRLRDELGLDETPASSGEVTKLPLGSLRLSPDNVRKDKTDAEADAALAANIRTRGIVQNLVVYEADDGGYEVTAGGRRLAALRSLDLPEDHPVPCLVVARKDAIAISLAENTQRLAMSVIDELIAWQRLVVEQGRAIGHVAAEFGVSPRTVRQRLKLAAVAPDLLDLFRASEIDLETMMAFTLSDDHERQRQAWAEASKAGSWVNKARVIKTFLTEGKVSGNSSLGRFVGIEAYEAEGGEIGRDLFSDPEDPASYWFEQPAILQRLAQERLDAEAASLRSDWAWVESATDMDEYHVFRAYGREPGELPELPANVAAEAEQLQTELDTLESKDDLSPEDEQAWHACRERLDVIGAWPEENVVYGDEVRGRTGCIVTIGDTGNLRVIKGLVKRDDDVAHPEQAGGEMTSDAQRQGSGVVGVSSMTPAKAAACDGAAEPDQENSIRMSGVLCHDLGAHRTQCLQAALVADPDLAQDVVIYVLQASVLSSRGCWDNPSELTARSASLSSTLEDLGDTQPARELATALQGLPSGLAGQVARGAVRRHPNARGRGESRLAGGVGRSQPEGTVDRPRPCTVASRPDRRSVGWRCRGVVPLAADRGHFLGADSDAGGARHR